MIGLDTIEAFSAIHVSLLSLTIVDALSWLCEQVIIFILDVA
jgi:hypothetical protein